MSLNDDTGIHTGRGNHLIIFFVMYNLLTVNL